MEKINDIVEDSIRFAFDGLSDEHDTYVEYLTDKENKYGDRPQIYRIQIAFDPDYISPEKIDEIVKIILSRIDIEPDKWTFDGISEVRIYWLDENAEEMAEKYSRG